MATELAKAYVQVIPSAEGITGHLGSVMGGEADKAGKSSGESLAKTLGSTFKKAFVALGIGKIISDVIGNTSEFETGMAKVKTLFSGTAEEFSQLQEDILGMSSAYGISVQELTEAAYSAESAGVAQEDMLYMLEHSAELAKAGFTDLDTALSATAKTMNAYGDAAGTAEDIQKVLIQTQNLGITTVGELGQSLANVTPTAAAMGVSFDQVGASLALMTAKGTPTAQATTQLRSAMVELGKDGTKGAKALQKAAKGTQYAGKSFKEMMESGADLGEIMGMLQKYADKTGVSMVDLFSSVEAGNAAMSIASDVEKFTENLEAMGTEADVVGEGYKTMASTFGESMNKMKTSFSNLGIALSTGVDIGPALDSLIASLSDVLVGAGTMIFNMIKGIFENIPKIFENMKDLGKTLLKKLKEIDWKALGTAILDGVTYILDNAGEWLHDIFTTAWEAVKNIDWKKVGKAILDGIKKILDSAGNFLADLLGIGRDAAAGEDMDYSSIGTAIWNGITSIITVAGDWLSGLFTTAIGAVGELNFGEIGSSILTAITGILSPGGENFLGGIFKSGEKEIKEIDWQKLGENVAQAGSELINLTGEALAGAFTAAETIISTIDWETLGKTVGNAANGLVSLTGEVLSAAFTAAEAMINAIDWEGLGTIVGNAANGLINLTGEALAGAFTAAESLINGIDWAGLGETAASAANGLINLTGEALAGAFTAAESLINGIDWAGMGETAASAANGLINLTGEALAGGFTAAESLIKGINWEGLGQNVAKVGNAVIDVIGTGGDLIKAPFEAARDFISGVDWNALGGTVQSGLQKAFDGVADALSGVLSGIGAAAGGIGEGIGTAAAGLGTWFANLLNGDDISSMEEKVRRIETAMDNMKKSISEAAKDAGKNAKEVSKAIKEGLESELLKDQIKKLGTNAVQAIKDGINGDKSNVANEFKTMMADTKSEFDRFDWKGIGTNVTTKIKDGISGGKNTIASELSGIRTDAKKEFSKFDWKGIGSSLTTAIKDGIGSKIDDAKKKAGELKNALSGAIYNKRDWETIGENIVAGIKKGIEDKKSQLIDVCKSIAKDSLAAIKKELGISSPSKVMRDQVGRWIPAGIAAGIDKYSGTINTAMDSIAENLSGTGLQSFLMAQAGRLAVGTAGGGTMAAGGFNQNITINSPEALTPSEIARQTRIQTQNMVLTMMGA